MHADLRISACICVHRRFFVAASSVLFHFGQEFFVLLGDTRSGYIVWMNQYAIPEKDALPFLYHVPTILALISSKISQPERIRGKEPVGAHVPGSRMAETARVIHNGHA